MSRLSDVKLALVVVQALEAAGGVCCGGRPGLDEQLQLAGVAQQSTHMLPCHVKKSKLFFLCNLQSLPLLFYLIDNS